MVDIIDRVHQRKPSLDIENPFSVSAHVNDFHVCTIPIRIVAVIVVPNMNIPDFAEALWCKNNEPVVVETLQNFTLRAVQPMGLCKYLVSQGIDKIFMSTYY